MEENKDIKKELEDLSPWLHQLKSAEKNNAKTLPQHYFSNLEDRLMSRIKEEEALEGAKAVDSTSENWWSRLLTKLWQPQYAVGIGVIGAVLILFMVDFGKNNVEAPITDASTLLAELSVDETTAYILDNLQEFETTEITAIVTEELINETIVEELPKTTTTTNTPAPVNTIEKALEQLEEEEEFLDELTEEEIEELDIF